MAGGSLLGLNIPLLVFLLAPGYIGLKGYLKASVQLDSISRTDKLILGLIGGLTSLGVMLLLNRFGILTAVIDFWYSLSTDRTWSSQIQFDRSNAVTLERANSVTALALMGFLLGQSAIAYIGGYLYGIHCHVASDEKPKSRVDLEQPWERAVKDSAITDEITVITKDGEEIQGDLYRIGSPSKNYDILLSGAEKVVQGGDNKELGVTYHHHQDISRIEIDVPGINPEDDLITEYDTWLARRYSYLRIWLFGKYNRFCTGIVEWRTNPQEKLKELGQQSKDYISKFGSQLGSRESNSSEEIYAKLKTASQRASRLESELPDKES